MQRTIHQLDTTNNVLRKTARQLSKEEILTPEIQSLIQEMKEIMRSAPGVGLAAPQIGVSIQLAVIEDSEERLKVLSPETLMDRGRKPVAFHVLINPEIMQLSGKINYFFEGCLSINGQARITPRPETVTVQYLDEYGEKKEITASGWYARILQHEISHLNGKLYIDIADVRTEVATNEAFKEKWLNASREAILRFYKDKCPDIASFETDNSSTSKLKK